MGCCWSISAQTEVRAALSTMPAGQEKEELSTFYRHPEIPCRRGPVSLPERGDECARRTVACFQSGVRNLCALSQQAHRLHETKLLTPFTECHSRLAAEEPLHGSFAGTAHPADLRERQTVAGARHQHLGNPQRSGIG